MHQCLRGCYQWVTSGQKEIQSLDQEAIQILKAIQKSLEAVSRSGQITSDKSCCVEMRQAMNQPKSTDAIRFTDMFAQGESWTLSPACLQELARQLRLGNQSYGQLKASNDQRRGQYQVWDRTRASMQGPLYKLTWKLPHGSSHMEAPMWELPFGSFHVGASM